MRATAARVVPCVCALGVVMLAAQPCAAQSLDLVWQAPPECPTLEEVRPILDAVIPLELRETLAETRVVIEIVAGAQYVATIRVERAGHVGERVVEGTRCAEVARSALIVVSVALSDPTATAEPVAPDAAPRPQEDTAAVEPDAVSQPVRWGVDGGVGVISGLGDAPVVPRLSLGVFHALHPALQLGLRAQAAPFVPLRHMGERVARAATLTLAPVACALGGASDRVRLGGCLSVEVGVTLARGLGLDENARGAVRAEKDARGVGRLRFRRDGTFVSKPGIVDVLEEVDDGIWNIVYYQTLLGRIDERTARITGITERA